MTCFCEKVTTKEGLTYQKVNFQHWTAIREESTPRFCFRTVETKPGIRANLSVPFKCSKGSWYFLFVFYHSNISFDQTVIKRYRIISNKPQNDGFVILKTLFQIGGFTLFLSPTFERGIRGGVFTFSWKGACSSLVQFGQHFFRNGAP